MLSSFEELILNGVFVLFVFLKLAWETEAIAFTDGLNPENCEKTHCIFEYICTPDLCPFSPI